MNAPYLPDYDTNSICEYHMGTLGYTMDNCKALKHKVQDLIDGKAFTFMPTGKNVRTNPMLTHVGPLVNVVEESDNQELIKKVEEIQASLLVIGEQLIKDGLILKNHVDGEGCITGPENGEILKSCIQQLVD